MQINIIKCGFYDPFTTPSHSYSVPVHPINYKFHPVFFWMSFIDFHHGDLSLENGHRWGTRHKVLQMDSISMQAKSI